MACCYKLSVNQIFVGVAFPLLTHREPPPTPPPAHPSEAKSRFTHVCMGRIFGVDDHGVAADVREGEERVCVCVWGRGVAKFP